MVSSWKKIANPGHCFAVWTNAKTYACFSSSNDVFPRTYMTHHKRFIQLRCNLHFGQLVKMTCNMFWNNLKSTSKKPEGRKFCFFSKGTDTNLGKLLIFGGAKLWWGGLLHMATITPVTHIVTVKCRHMKNLWSIPQEWHHFKTWHYKRGCVRKHRSAPL